MVEDIDIYRTAKFMIKQHGDKALSKACKKEAFFNSYGDSHAASTWRKICDAIQFLQVEDSSLIGKTCH